MILFFIPNKDNISNLVKKIIKKHSSKEKKYFFIPSTAIKYYSKINKNNIFLIDGLLDFIKNSFNVLFIKNKTRSYIFLTNSSDSNIWIKFLGLISAWERKIVNENGDYFDAFNLIIWLRYFKWRIKDSSSISLRRFSTFAIFFIIPFIIIRLILFFLYYQFISLKKYALSKSFKTI